MTPVWTRRKPPEVWSRKLGLSVSVVCLLLSAGCARSGQAPLEHRVSTGSAHMVAPNDALGWSGTIQAREVRRWTGDALERVSRWTLSEPPIGIAVPDSVEVEGGRVLQLYALSGTIFRDGRVLLVMHYPGGPFRVATTTSTLERFRYSPAAEEGVGPLGPGDEFPPRTWIHGGSAPIHDDGVVVAGDPIGEPGHEEVYHLDAQGRLTRPPGRVGGRMGRLLGGFRDGSVLFWGYRYVSVAADSLVGMHLVSVRPSPEAGLPSGAAAPEVVLTLAVERDVGQRRPRPRSSYHLPFARVGVSGDTIWAVPTERPALLALNRSGEALLRVEWEAGDRRIPVSERESDEWGGLERFPAASRLVVGADGLVYVQRWTLRDGTPAMGPEWLVFHPSGELVGRLEIPRVLQVSAFGDGTVLASRTYRAGFSEIRVYRVNRSGIGQ